MDAVVYACGALSSLAGAAGFVRKCRMLNSSGSVVSTDRDEIEMTQLHEGNAVFADSHSADDTEVDGLDDEAYNNGKVYESGSDAIAVHISAATRRKPVNNQQQQQQQQPQEVEGEEDGGAFAASTTTTVTTKQCILVEDTTSMFFTTAAMSWSLRLVFQLMMLCVAHSIFCVPIFAIDETTSVM